MGEHTKGPWQTGRHLRDAKNGGDFVILLAHGRWIGDLRCNDDEDDANVKLIAAAPDLLEACEAYYYGRKENRECEAMMRAAIAKATGVAT
jgi:hypothetical protein